MGVGKVRAGAAELGGQGVHLLHKSLDRAAYVLGDDIAGLVRGGEQRAVEQVLERHRLPGDYAGGAAVVHHALKARSLAVTLSVRENSPRSMASTATRTVMTFVSEAG